MAPVLILERAEKPRGVDVGVKVGRKERLMNDRQVMWRSEREVTSTGIHRHEDQTGKFKL